MSSNKTITLRRARGLAWRHRTAGPRVAAFAFGSPAADCTGCARDEALAELQRAKSRHSTEVPLHELDLLHRFTRLKWPAGHSCDPIELAYQLPALTQMRLRFEPVPA